MRGDLACGGLREGGRMHVYVVMAAHRCIIRCPHAPDLRFYHVVCDYLRMRALPTSASCTPPRPGDRLAEVPALRSALTTGTLPRLDDDDHARWMRGLLLRSGLCVPLGCDSR